MPSLAGAAQRLWTVNSQARSVAHSMGWLWTPMGEKDHVLRVRLPERPVHAAPSK